MHGCLDQNLDKMEKKKLKTNQKNIIKKSLKSKNDQQNNDKELIKLYTTHNEAP